MLQRTLSRKLIIEKILISKFYRDLSFIKNCEKFKFSKTSFFDKTFREPGDFEMYSSKSDFEKIISKKLRLNNIYRKHKFLDKFIKDCDKSRFSRKNSYTRIELILKIHVRFFSKELFQ